jgi:hypothetical protein
VNKAIYQRPRPSQNPTDVVCKKKENLHSRRSGHYSSLFTQEKGSWKEITDTEKFHSWSILIPKIAVENCENLSLEIVSNMFGPHAWKWIRLGFMST